MTNEDANTKNLDFMTMPKTPITCQDNFLVTPNESPNHYGLPATAYPLLYVHPFTAFYGAAKFLFLLQPKFGLQLVIIGNNYTMLKINTLKPCVKVNSLSSCSKELKRPSILPTSGANHLGMN